MASEAVEMEVINEHVGNKPASAPAQSSEPSQDDPMNRKALFRRSTGSKKRRRKPSRMSSSSSLHSLVSILKPTHSDQRSVPNVSFGDGNDYNDINIGAVSKNNISMCPSIGETSSQFQYTMEGEGSSRVAGGSFSTQTSTTIGFRASFFSVLEKLGVWRSQDLYRASQSASETKFPAERKPRSSVTSLYFRTLYGGKFSHDSWKLN